MQFKDINRNEFKAFKDEFTGKITRYIHEFESVEKSTIIGIAVKNDIKNSLMISYT